jgi:arylsulfatase A-like enzyme
MKRFLLSVCFFTLVSVVAAAATPNVLLIAVDDLRDWPAYLGRKPHAFTPHLDRLAARGVAFTRAYCAAPSCNPSRAALMSGLRPSATGVYDNGQDWRTAIPPERTLVSAFRRGGYRAFSVGKIYHDPVFERPSEWDECVRVPEGGGSPAAAAPTVVHGALRYGAVEADDEAFLDARTVRTAAGFLARAHDRPFLLTVGLSKPHLPWFVPKKYFDLYPLEGISLPPHRAGDLADVPPEGVTMALSHTYHAAVERAGQWKHAVQAALASISFCDAMVGRLLDALDRSPHRDNTVVVLFSDHGWHLGEKEHWRKFALWEEATRVPLIWIAPGVTPAGGICVRAVDLMHLFPTLMDLCGLPVPEHVGDPSIRPLLADPKAPWARPALTTWLRANHAVRTERWRYIRYAGGGEELYDHDVDPDEWTNLAADPAHTALKAELAKSFPVSDAPAGPHVRKPDSG